MRDGTVLRADVYRPTTGGPWPVLLARTPYGRSEAGLLARLDPGRAADRGFLVVIQDCRGRFGSAGDWIPLAHEAADGYDTIAWAARLPGADGRVAMYGPSYLGHAQWAAAAVRPPALHAVVPELTWHDPYDGLLARGGANEFGLVTQWTLTLGADVLERRFADRPSALHDAHAQLADARDAFPRDDAISRLALPRPRPETAKPAAPKIPALIVAGWYDCFLQGALDAYAAARREGTPVSLIVGPWSHENQSSRIGEVDFGKAADAATIDGADSLLDRELDWLARRLGAAAPTDPLLVFVMGRNTWRRIAQWPPAATDTPWFLHHGGRLSPDLPAPDAAPGVFRSDPDNPVTTHGGPLLLTADFPAGPHDQRQVEERDDVLVYTSDPLRAPLEIMGRVRLRLTAQSTAPVTDWVARLCDVDVDGVSRNITDGVLRTARADGQEHVIDLWSTAHVFLPGHRIRVQVTGSCFPRWDRVFAAHQTVYHDAARPSALILPTRPSPLTEL